MDERHWVPLYFEGGPTIGKVRISDDNKHIVIDLNEGEHLGDLIKENLLGFSTVNMAVNDAQKVKEKTDGI